MKKLIWILASAALTAGGCSKENGPTDAEGVGTIRIACKADAGIDIDAGAATAGMTRAGAAAPAGEAFALRITGTDFDRSWESVAAFNAEEAVFVKGDYSIAVSYGDPEAEGVDKPYYAGQTSIEVLPRRANTARITARVAKSQALVRATEAFKKYYHDAEFTLTTGSGNAFTFRPCDAGEEETVWVKASTSLTLKGTARGQSQDGISKGPLYDFSPEPLDATRIATRHIFLLDATKAGSVTLTITLGDDDTVTQSINPELNEGALE